MPAGQVGPQPSPATAGPWSKPRRHAPGWPGIPGRWTSSAKVGVGTALNRASRVWFTLSHGILNEVYYPRLDQACIRDLGLIVTDGKRASSRRRSAHTRSEARSPASGVPAFGLSTRAREGRYRIEKQHPQRPAAGRRPAGESVPAAVGGLADYRLYALLAPHLGNRGSGKHGLGGRLQGRCRCSSRSAAAVALALACSVPWLTRSVGFVGAVRRLAGARTAQAADADLRAGRRRKRRPHGRDRSGARTSGRFVLALGFGSHRIGGRPPRARQPRRRLRRRAASNSSDEWSEWQGSLRPRRFERSRAGACPTCLRISATRAATPRVQARSRAASSPACPFPGGRRRATTISAAITSSGRATWWRRPVDCWRPGRVDDVRRVLGYLEAIQEADGHWAQNTWLDGSPLLGRASRWTRRRCPILLVDLAARHGAPRAQPD